MISKWYDHKEQAVGLRRKGKSIREIEKQLSIPRSTLSGWFKNIKLNKDQKSKLKRNWRNALIKAREKAVIWHNMQKRRNIEEARLQSELVISRVDIGDKDLWELALAMLYLGEGAKSNGLALGNSNPLIVKFFIKCLTSLYNIDVSKLKCELHLRSDQNEEELKNFWSEQLAISKSSFKFYKDKRTIQKETYPEYKGVCVVRCGGLAVQRKILFLSQEFCEKIINHKDP